MILGGVRVHPGKGDHAAQVLPAGCGECHSAPFVVHERGATRCGCLRGQALRQMDQRRVGRPEGERRQPRPVVYRSPLPETQ